MAALRAQSLAGEGVDGCVAGRSAGDTGTAAAGGATGEGLPCGGNCNGPVWPQPVNNKIVTGSANSAVARILNMSKVPALKAASIPELRLRSWQDRSQNVFVPVLLCWFLVNC